MITADYTIKTGTTVVMSTQMRSHPNIGCLSPDGMIYYHMIPKNASSFLTGILKSWDYSIVNHTYQIPVNTKGSIGLCILRDPIQRWISGITQFLADVIDTDASQSTWDNVFRLVTKQPYQDNHTAPQLEFLKDHDLDWFHFHYMHHTKSVGEGLNTWLQTRNGKENITRFEKKNVSNSVEAKKKIYDHVKNKLKSDPNLNSRIKEFYRSDYELIDWVGRNQKWIPSI